MVRPCEKGAAARAADSVVPPFGMGELVHEPPYL